MFWKKAEQIAVMTPAELAKRLAEGCAPVLVDVRNAHRNAVSIQISQQMDFPKQK